MVSVLPSTSKIKSSPDQATRGKKQWMIYAGGALIVLLFALINVFIYQFSQGFVRKKVGLTLFERLSKKPQQLVVAPTPTPRPTPIPIPIAPGKQVYTISSDSKSDGPSISQASFDPLDVSKGGQMAVEVKAKDPLGVRSISVMIIDDVGKTPHELTLTGGTKNDGVWSGTWQAVSTHERVYGATIEAVNTASEKRSIELWFR